MFFNPCVAAEATVLSTKQNKAKQNITMAKHLSFRERRQFRKCARHQTGGMESKREAITNKPIQ